MEVVETQCRKKMRAEEAGAWVCDAGGFGSPWPPAHRPPGATRDASPPHRPPDFSAQVPTSANQVRALCVLEG